jgi:hypothetical protein
MNNKKNYFLFFISFVLGITSISTAITKDELGKIISTTESSISDIYIEYDWLNIPEWTIEDFNEDFNKGNRLGFFPQNGKRSFKLYLARNESDSNDPNKSPLNWNFRSEENTTLFTENNNTFQQTTIKSYGGQIGRSLDIGGFPRVVKTVQISSKRPSISLPLSPLGFSVYRTSLSGATGYYPLSEIFKKSPDLIILDETVRKIDGFNTIRAVFLQQSTKQPIMRVYFSKDHNYYPVRYEYLKGPDKVDFMFRVETLEKIGDNLWFPSSGVISASDTDRADAFQTTAPILCNQHKNSDVFEIEITPGTKVWDDINNTKYIAK